MSKHEPRRLTPSEVHPRKCSRASRRLSMAGPPPVLGEIGFCRTWSHGTAMAANPRVHGTTGESHMSAAGIRSQA